MADFSYEPSRSATKERSAFSQRTLLMRIILTAFFCSTFASAAFAGMLGPMPGAGVAGPVALLVAIGTVTGVKYLRNRRGK
jgi:hypothetical protein